MGGKAFGLIFGCLGVKIEGEKKKKKTIEIIFNAKSKILNYLAPYRILDIII